MIREIIKIKSAFKHIDYAIIIKYFYVNNYARR